MVKFILVRVDFVEQILASIEFQFEAFLMLPVILEKFSLTDDFDVTRSLGHMLTAFGTTVLPL